MKIKPVYETFIAKATEENPRNDHSLIFPLADDRLVAAWSEYYARNPSSVTTWRQEECQVNKVSDQFPCRITARISADRGRSWSARFTLQENTNERNVKQPNLVRLETGEILFFFTAWESNTRRNIFMRRSNDEIESWSTPVQVSEPGFYCNIADHILKLSNGRIILPAHGWAGEHDYRHSGPSAFSNGKGRPIHSFVYYSDDGFKTWRRSRDTMTAPGRGAHEPAVIELEDGSLLCFLRTTLGRIYQAMSDDGGESWSTPEPGPLVAPDASPIIKRIPSTGDLLAIWNDNYVPGHHHTGERTPLAVAVSRDEACTWECKQYLETADPGNFSTPTVTFVGDEALFNYYACEAAMSESHRYDVKLKVVKVADLYSIAGSV